MPRRQSNFARDCEDVQSSLTKRLSRNCSFVGDLAVVGKVLVEF